MVQSGQEPPARQTRDVLVGLLSGRCGGALAVRWKNRQRDDRDAEASALAAVMRGRQLLGLKRLWLQEMEGQRIIPTLAALLPWQAARHALPLIAVLRAYADEKLPCAGGEVSRG